MKFLLLAIVPITVSFLFIAYEATNDDIRVIEANAKIESLEEELAQKTKEYEWLEEITNSLLKGNPEDFVREFNKLKEQSNSMLGEYHLEVSLDK